MRTSTVTSTEYKFYSRILGFSAASVTVAPNFYVFGIPIAYSLVILLTLRKILFVREISASGIAPFFIWLLPIMLGLIIGSLMKRPDWFSLITINLITLTTGYLIFESATSTNSVVCMLYGAVPVVLANAVVALFQLYGASWAFALSYLVSPWNELTAHGGELVSSRVWGLQGMPHIFAYCMAGWALVYYWGALRAKIKKNTARFLLFIAILCTLVVFISAQRAAVWILVPAITIVSVLSTRGRQLLPWLLVAGGIAAALLLYQYTSDPSSISVTQRLFTSHTSGDVVRKTTWGTAWELIQQYPFWGGGFHEYSLDIGIHNGILNGWLSYGLLWVISLFLASLVLVMRIARDGGTKLDKTTAFLLLLVTLANTLFHTSAPTLGDMDFFVNMGFLLALIKTGRNEPFTRATAIDPIPHRADRDLVELG